MEILLTWLIESFKWFSYLVGASLIFYLFSKDKYKIDATFSFNIVIQFILFAQPIAVANVFSHFSIQGKLPLYISMLFTIPFLVF